MCTHHRTDRGTANDIGLESLGHQGVDDANVGPAARGARTQGETYFGRFLHGHPSVRLRRPNVQVQERNGLSGRSSRYLPVT
jgi:hypothetical protein